MTGCPGRRGQAGVIPGRNYPRSPLSAERRRDPAPLLVFLPRGGWVLGDLDATTPACRLISRDAGITSWRSTTDWLENCARAAIDDAHAAYRWARERAFDLGADHDWSRSAATVSEQMAVVTRLARDLPAIRCRRCNGIYPVTDLRAEPAPLAVRRRFLLTKHDMDWFQNCYVEGSGLEFHRPLVSTAVGISPDCPGVGGDGRFRSLRDEGDQYAARLREAGVAVDHRRMPSMIHGFINLQRAGRGQPRQRRDHLGAPHLAHRRTARRSAAGTPGRATTTVPDSKDQPTSAQATRRAQPLRPSKHRTASATSLVKIGLTAWWRFFTPSRTGAPHRDGA